jgi:glucose/arabinose dehydrogenase
MPRRIAPWAGHRGVNRFAFLPNVRRVLCLKLALLLAVPAALVTGALLAPSGAAAPPADFQTSLVVGDGLDQPSGFEIAPDGRIFVLERPGKIRIIKNGQLLAEPFAELPSEATGDRGLIGIAFDPEFGTTNHYVYFYYTGHDLLNRLVRFNAAEDIGTDGPYLLFQTQSPSQLLHVGGSIRFGPDGKLYFAVGDNGTGEKAQDLSNPHGKILRINSDGSIPTDNPFYGQPGKLGSIWAYGFRNPWRFQFDSATGQLYGGDVGDYTWEEVNHIVKGGNYGWPIHEGTCLTSCAGIINPIHLYNHDGQSSAVTGGPVYRGSMFPPEYQGNLFFGDYARGFIKRAQLDGNGNVTAVYDFDNQAGSVVDLKVAPDGSLYYVTYYPGALYRITYNTLSHRPVATATADVTKGVEPLTVHFSSAGSVDPDGDPLSYLWMFGDGTSSTEANPTKTYAAKGVYTARLTVTAGEDQTPAQPIVVQVGIPPTLTVATPAEGMRYRAGDTITYNAFANDAAGFDLNDADIKTVVRLHHGTHYHPFVGPLIGRAGSFTIPNTGEASADTSYELTVTATDRNGLTTAKSVTIVPRRSNLTLTTSPPGLGVILDGVPVSTPRTVQGVAGFQRALAAPVTAVAADGTPLHFAGWSDGRSVRHTIVTPDADTTYTAIYRPSAPFTASYYNNHNLAGSPVLARQDPKIDFVWGDGAPDPALPADGFAVRWTKTEYFGGGRYRFSTVTDDGVRLYIDNKRVIDEWHGQPPTEHSYVADLGTGNHRIEVEYFEGGGGAVAMLTWDSTVEQPGESFHARYWNMPPGIAAPAIPDSPPVIARDEPAIDHDWGAGSPDAAIAPNLFLARWTRTLNLAPGEYDFTVTADDGVRLVVDGVRAIDRWVDESPTTYTARLPMDGGPHTIAMDYYEGGGGAQARLDFAQVGDIPPPPAYEAEYWNTPDGGASPSVPTGPPDLVRSDPQIDFDWWEGSPSPQITPDHFVARWTRTDTLSAGVYNFAGMSDDGIRVFVDNVPVVDLWQLRRAAYSVDKVLLSGQHTIRVEYFEAGSGALATFDYQRVGEVRPDDGGYSAEYFADQDLSGVPALTRQDDAVNFDWGAGSPGGAIPADHFSARWSKSAVLAAGTYAFTVTSDDGARLLVDGVPIINRWLLQGPTTYTAKRYLDQGTHQIVLEYFENAGGALARLDFEHTDEPPPPAAGRFTAEYFANATLAGTPAVTRNEEAVDFDWGYAGSPDAALPADNFSARWTKTADYEDGTYRFTAVGDDGIRVLVDGNLVIDGWSDHPPTAYFTDVPLAAGAHTVVVEYYERNGGAIARLIESQL